MIALNFLFYNDEDSHVNAARVSEFVKSCGIGHFISRIVVVNNGRIGQVAASAVHVQHAMGDNSVSEFSGWDSGLRLCCPLQHQEKGVLFVNDTVFAHAPLSLVERHQLRKGLDKIVKSAEMSRVLAGWLCRFFDETVNTPLGGLHAGYINSRLFFVSAALLSQIKTVALPADTLSLLRQPTGDNDWRYIEDERYRSYNEVITGWLNDPTSHRRWHRNAPLSDDNADFFFRKARAIYCEHSLTLRSRQVDAQIEDFHVADRSLYFLLFVPKQCRLTAGRLMRRLVRRIRGLTPQRGWQV